MLLKFKHLIGYSSFHHCDDNFNYNVLQNLLIEHLSFSIEPRLCTKYQASITFVQSGPKRVNNILYLNYFVNKFNITNNIYMKMCGPYYF